jgi:eukaryotic-like serine/threonine-protein kinase
LALCIAAGRNPDIWIWDLVRKTLTRLTFDLGIDDLPVWSPDGKQIAFLAFRNDRFGIFRKAVDGTGKEDPFSSPADRFFGPWSWLDNGKILVLEERSGSKNIGILSTEGASKWKPLLEEKYNEEQPHISPDGRWMSYVSDESGQAEVYVRPFPDVNKGKWQVSTSGGHSPRWSRDGRMLFYRSDDTVMAASVRTDPTFSFETPGALFRGTYVSESETSYWDISPDGKRFLMIKPPASTGAVPTAEGPRKINIVLNWFEELKQRVPVK